MVDWKSKVKRPLNTFDAFILLGNMLEAKATWPEAAEAFRVMQEHAMEAIDLETGGELPKSERHVIVLQQREDMIELEKRFRPWLEKDLDLP